MVLTKLQTSNINRYRYKVPIQLIYCSFINWSILRSILGKDISKYVSCAQLTRGDDTRSRRFPTPKTRTSLYIFQEREGTSKISLPPSDFSSVYSIM